jgi:hypothetical protein
MLTSLERPRTMVDLEGQEEIRYTMPSDRIKNWCVGFEGCRSVGSWSLRRFIGGADTWCICCRIVLLITRQDV